MPFYFDALETMSILARNTPPSPLRPAWRPCPWWSGFTLSLLLPSALLAFLLTGPHRAGAALAWTLPVWLLIAADYWGPAERRNISPSAPRWFFDDLLYALAALQLLNLLAMGLLVSRLGWADGPAIGTSLANLLALRILGGTNACCSVIAPAHELLHRRSHWQRGLGRWLLMTVFHDRFYVAHRIGHHARLGGPEDPSTAQMDESYEAFCRRSLAGQWRMAWRHQPRALLYGLAAELFMAGLYGLAFGGLALFMWGYINVVAVRLLEAVNYFQHFGLTRPAGQARPAAWRCDSAVSLFLFLGLTRHADHHRRPGVRYPELEATGEGPVLPLGYLGMAIWVKNASGSFRRWAVGEGFVAGRRPGAKARVAG